MTALAALRTSSVTTRRTGTGPDYHSGDMKSGRLIRQEHASTLGAMHRAGQDDAIGATPDNCSQELVLA